MLYRGGFVTSGVVRHPFVDDVDRLLRFCEVHLVGMGLEGLDQGPAVSFLQTHLPLHHHRTGRLHAILAGKILVQKTLLP